MDKGSFHFAKIALAGAMVTLRRIQTQNNIDQSMKTLSPKMEQIFN
jgi:hypothetical protein